MTEIEKDYTLEEVAKAMRMSTRWVRDRIKFDKVEHQRKGRKITFTAAQVEKLRTAQTKAPAPEQAITTGRKKRPA